MNFRLRFVLVALVVLVASCDSCPAPCRCDGASKIAMERIEIAGDGRGFVLLPSKKPFHPWGLNYGHHGKLIEDFWAAEWPVVEADFRAMKRIGANVARVHLQFGKFMTGPDTPDAGALERLEKLVALAEETGIYLDLTGLACYRAADIPAWYDAMTETERWDAQARFWNAVAGRCAKSPAIFCYDLINEPLSPADKRKPKDWYTGQFGEYQFLQYISLDRAGRARDEIVRLWLAKMIAAIRRADPDHKITVGMLPSNEKWGHFSGFIPEKVATQLDYISVHIYPETGKVADALKVLRGFSVGKPVVIEETFPLSCSPQELEEFMRPSREFACGWVGHYDGETPEELKALEDAKKITLHQAAWFAWLKMFQKLRPEFVRDEG